VEDFGLPLDARRVRFEVGHHKRKGWVRWYDGQVPGETAPPEAEITGYGDEGKGTGGSWVVDAFLGEDGTVRFRVHGGKIQFDSVPRLLAISRASIYSA
jgi:hypothetical protein